MTRLHDDMRRLVQEQPDLTYGKLLSQLRDLGWQLELGSFSDPALLDSLPAWTALLSLPRSNRSSPPPDNTVPTQLIDSGEVRVFTDLLPSENFIDVRAFCNNHFSRPGLPPIGLSHLQEPLRTRLLEVSLAVVREVLDRIFAPGHPLAGQTFVLLMNRCLLRRTYPPHSWDESLCNANNQHWHQDSNEIFASRPMLTFWLPLQSGAGRTCPGLEVSSLPATFFSSLCGDSTLDHSEVCREHGCDHATISLLDVTLGSVAAFNGLTYHRTAIRQEMSTHRDALLLRVCLEPDAKFFPGDRNADVVL